VVSGGDFLRAYPNYNRARRPPFYTQLKSKNEFKIKHEHQARRLKLRGVYERRPRSPPTIVKIEGTLTSNVKGAREYMEDAPGARRRRSTWKTPGGGRQNAAAIKFVGPASTRATTTTQNRATTPQSTKRNFPGSAK